MVGVQLNGSQTLSSNHILLPLHLLYFMQPHDPGLQRMRTVLPPTTMASERMRASNTSWREADEDTQAAWPAARRNLAVRGHRILQHREGAPCKRAVQQRLPPGKCHPSVRERVTGRLSTSCLQR